MSETGKDSLGRSVGLVGATAIGVGAIVGGGVLALAGVAFGAAGPSAVVAFMLNGVIALLTAFSFAEMAASFPESGGTYTFAKKVLSAPAAFMVGWVVWFASVVASVLYALGFASYAAGAVENLLDIAGFSPPFSLTTRGAAVFLAVVATLGYSLSLVRKSGEGGQWATWGKVAIFVIIIVAGLWVLAKRPGSLVEASLSPFFTAGSIGLFQAMGYTFIALQGFDVVAAVAGEVKDPDRNIPRAMFLSLGIALAIYLPLLLVIATVGVSPGLDITQMSLQHPETVIALAVQNYLGPLGYWLVMAAAILAMLSALRANLLAASRVAFSMARDRTLPPRLGQISRSRKTPVPAIAFTAAMATIILLTIPSVAAAGAAASLIFLVSFALAHWTSILARVRSGGKGLSFLTPWFPTIQVVGLAACVALAIFEGTQVPSAGIIGATWLGAGVVLYLSIFARRARIVDASNAAMDPQLLVLRGRSPLVLVPIANPANARFMVSLAHAMAPPAFGRVLLLSVVNPPEKWRSGSPPQQLLNSQAVVEESLTASFAYGLAPEALITVAPHRWREIIRVARTYRCESLLLGLSDLAQKRALRDLERLMSSVDCDVVVLRAAAEWDLARARKVLVPVGGRGQQDRLRARILGSLHHMGMTEITFLRILPEHATEESLTRAHKWLERLAEDELGTGARIVVVRNDRPASEIVRRSGQNDLLILGLQRLGRRQKVFGEVALRTAKETSCGLILISRKG